MNTEDLIPQHDCVLSANPVLPPDFLARQIQSEAMTALPAVRIPRAVAYLRRSKKEENDSIERQTERTTFYASDRLKQTIAHFYIDKGKTGETWHRKQFKKMMEDAEAGAFTILIVEEVDRLGRTLAIVSTVCDRLARLGIEVHTLAKGGVVQLVDVAFGGMMATQHQVLLKERTKDGLWRAVKKGAQCSLCWGYKKAPGKNGGRVVDESLRPHIEWMFQARLDGMTLAQIAKVMNDRKLPKRFAKTPWISAEVRDILLNMIYAGIFVFGRNRQWRDVETDKIMKEARHSDDWHKSKVPHCQIVSIETWNAVYRTFNKNKPGPKRGKTFLSGKVHCAYCARPMTYHQSQGKNFRVYTCRLGQTEHSPAQVVDFTWLNELVLNTIRGYLADEALEMQFQQELHQHYSEAIDEAAESREELTKRHGELKEQLKRAFDDEIADRFPTEIAAERTKSLTDEFKWVQAQLAALPKPQTGLPQVDPERRKSLLLAFDLLLHLVNQHGRQQVAFNPTELQILETVRKMVKSIEVTAIEGTYAQRVRVTILLQHVYGLAYPSFAQSETERVVEAVCHRRMNTGSEAMIEQTFRKGLYVSTEAEFSAIIERHGDALRPLFAKDPSMIVATIDTLFFMATMGTPLRFLRHLRPWDEHRGIGRGIRKLVTTGLWYEICSLLRTDFADRYATLHQALVDPAVPKRSWIES